MRKAFLFLFSTILFGECDGRIVSSIEIRINDLFTESQIDIVKTASNLKINTSPTIIKKIIPIKEGDICSSLKISETERKLRSFGVFRNVSVQTVNTNDNFVAVFVNVTDNWTITPRINFDSQKYSVKNFGLQDKNFLGLLKNLSVKKAEKELYDEIEISAQDKAFLNSDKRLNLVYSDKSEGKKYGFFLDSGIIDLIQPTGWSFQSVFDDTSFKRNGTEPVRVYLKEYIQIKGGYELQNPLAGGEWLKVGAGVRYENKEISRKGTDVPPELDYRWTGPYFRASLHKPAFKSLDYFNYFDFLEDIDVGFNFTTEVFLAPEILSSQNTVILSSVLNKGFAISEECLVFNTVRKQFRLEEFSNLENGVLDIKSDL
ncbi:MAG: hypothetical protein NZO16_08045, partial [Deltaproteobacteria bacterium]|nr:hypothetical protein [Deltaproteobacteria bacterium]